MTLLPLGSMPSVFLAVAGVLMRTPEHGESVALVGDVEIRRVHQVEVVDREVVAGGLHHARVVLLLSAVLGLEGDVPPLALWPYRGRSPRASTVPWCPDGHGPSGRRAPRSR